ncbi:MULTISPECIES: hypothetical protein [unclassified Rhizobium]|uniref:hypothetical protein n=1 Tax=unclassified Rhizobium TaxID=2613769 RepID=UPI0010F1C12F|nr:MULTISPECIES: hypothetical protein [unclassified Rhizobium]MBB4166507.1 hypothetical protein [Rhizobium sp. BK538]TCM81617.1 hypothetical protein EV291_10193 [Rhizobium sp. BK068]
MDKRQRVVALDVRSDDLKTIVLDGKSARKSIAAGVWPIDVIGSHARPGVSRTHHMASEFDLPRL